MVVWGYKKHSTKIVVMATKKQRIGQLKNSMGCSGIGREIRALRRDGMCWGMIGRARRLGAANKSGVQREGGNVSRGQGLGLKLRTAVGNDDGKDGLRKVGNGDLGNGDQGLGREGGE